MSYDPERKDWSILTEAENGTVSYIRQLTLAECRRIYERLAEDYGMVERRYVTPDGRSIHGGIYHTKGRSTGFRRRHVFGPEGWDEKEVEDWYVLPREDVVHVDHDWVAKNTRELRWG